MKLCRRRSSGPVSVFFSNRIVCREINEAARNLPLQTPEEFALSAPDIVQFGGKQIHPRIVGIIVSCGFHRRNEMTRKHSVLHNGNRCGGRLQCRERNRCKRFELFINETSLHSVKSFARFSCLDKVRKPRGLIIDTEDYSQRAVRSSISCILRIVRSLLILERPSRQDGDAGDHDLKYGQQSPRHRLAEASKHHRQQNREKDATCVKRGENHWSGLVHTPLTAQPAVGVQL